MFLTSTGSFPQKKASVRNKKCALIELTALTDEPVMCAIIFEGKNPKASIEAGIDISVTPVGKESDDDYF